MLFVFGVVLQSVRPLYGPMPQLACRLVIGIFQVFVPMNICLMGLSVTGARFAFAYLYKAMPVIDDDFWVKLVTRVTVTWSALATIGKYYTEDKVMITEVI